MIKVLLVLTAIFTYPQILMAIPEPEKNIQTVFSYDHVGLFFHNQFVCNENDEIGTLIYKQYITKRIEFTVIGLENNNYTSMHILIDSSDK